MTGDLKFRVLKQPGEGTRPITQKIRQAIFNTLGHDLAGLVVFDLYAGSGGLGFEALSLRADKVVFIEKSRAAAQLIIGAVSEFGLGERADVKIVPVEVALDVLGRAGVIFFDPPYESTDLQMAIRAAEHLEPGGVLVVSCSSRQKLPATLGASAQQKVRVYGSTQIGYYVLESKK